MEARGITEGLNAFVLAIPLIHKMKVVMLTVMKPTHKQAMVEIMGPNLPRLNGPGSKSRAFSRRTIMGMASAPPVC